MKILSFLICFSALACSTSRVTYEVSDKEPYVVSSVKEGNQVYIDREPDVVSVRPKITFNYPERINPGIYKVVSKVNVRDFPGMRGNVIGQLSPGETVVGNEIEGPWIRIYANSYTSLKSLRRIK